MLEALVAERTPMALVTNTARPLAERALNSIGRHYFSTTVCGDEVPSGKPAPDPYLRAAELLGVEPADCLAVEDSVTGTAAAELAGWSLRSPVRQEPPATTAKQQHDTAREIAFILQHAGPLKGTPAEAYLASRALDAPESADLLAHADLTHWETRQGYPALIGVVRNCAGEVIALHRTYLRVDPAQPDRVTKAPVSKPRMVLGKNGTGAVRLGPTASKKIS